MMSSTQDAILALARDEGLLRPLDLKSHRLPRVSLTHFVRQGRLARGARGLYALPDREVPEHSGLAEVARRHPRAVVCLLSALRFHELTTQAPLQVWLAIPNKALNEALGKGAHDRWVSIDELWHHARLDRVANVMRPYLEALA